VNNTSFFTRTPMAANTAKNHRTKPSVQAESRLVRETDLNTIQGSVVKQEYSHIPAKPTLAPFL
jgi:hypothetical protein